MNNTPAPQAPRTDLVATVKSNTVAERLKAVLPGYMAPARFQAVMTSVLAKQPELMECEPSSFLSAMITAAQLGLDPTPGKHQCYFIPFRNNTKRIVECQFISGWRGLVELARRSGEISRIEAHVVFHGEAFAYSKGLKPTLDHNPMTAGVQRTSANVTYAYAIAFFRDGSTQFEVMDRKQIDAIRDRGRRNPVWNTDYEEMARKTVVRRLAKYLPQTPELSQALADDQEDEIALPPSRTPERITEIQEEASAEANREIAAAHKELSELVRLVILEGGHPADLLGAFDAQDLTSVRVAIGKLQDFMDKVAAEKDEKKSH